MTAAAAKIATRRVVAAPKKTIVTPKNPWSTAMPDWEARILAGKSLVPKLPLFSAEAEPALRIFRKLRLHDVVGTPTMGEACDQWLFDFVEVVFGSYNSATATRMLQEFFMLIAKKNSKSTSAAGIMLTALIRNRRGGGEYLIVSPTISIADNSYKPAAAMIRLDPALDAKFHVQDNLRRITHRTTGAFMQVKAADTQVIGGQKATGILVDELWLFGQMSRGAAVMSEVSGSLASRPDGFIVYLTTQSDVPPAGIFLKKLIHHREVRDGKRVDPRSFQVLYEYPASLLGEKNNNAWMQEKYHYIANPNLGRSVSPSFLRDGLATAKNDGTESLILFAAKHFNIEIGVGLKSGFWIGAEHWAKRASPNMTLEDIIQRSEVLTVGVDGGGADDMLALAVIGRERITKRWLCWVHAWIHPIALERRKSNATEYEKLKAAGDLTIIEDYPQDLTELIAIVDRLNGTGLLAGVGLDRIGIDQAVDAFDEIGITEAGKTLQGVPQGFVLTGVIKSMERKLIDGSFLHGGQQLMNFAVANAKVEATKNAFLITKQASGVAKIDPLMAVFDAAYMMGRNPSAGGSVFDDPDEYAAAFGDEPIDGDDTDDEGEEASEADEQTWSPTIIADPKHPLFAEHARRFEAWQAEHDED